MARIVVGSYVVRFPLGGYLSWALQWLVGFQRLGHDVYFVEKSGWPDACFDPIRNVMSDDCSYGVATLTSLLARFSLEHHWCFVDQRNQHFGLPREQVQAVFDSADLFVDMGTHGAWLPEAERTGLRVLVDGEAAYTQMKLEQALSAGQALPEYDFYYTVGLNVGTSQSTAPTAGLSWRPAIDPVVVELFGGPAAPAGAPFTTIMSWQAHEPIAFGGVVYGQKDVEFEKFLDLPARTGVPLEIAVAGKDVPAERLRDAGWRLRDSHAVTRTYDTFLDYLRASRGEFSVCKNVFVATNSGWFSDRSAAYLASGRPVVMQDTGFSAHLPCGRGLFAVRSVDEAAAALDEIAGDYARQSKWARQIALDCLDARHVLRAFLDGLGIG